MEESSNLSAHDVIISKIILPSTQTILDTDIHHYEDFCTKKPLWNTDYLSIYQTETDKSIRILCDTYTENTFLPVLSEMISKSLVNIAEDTFDMRKPSEKPKNKLPFSQKNIRQHI